jgi:nitrogen regulatory protein PII
MKLIKAIIRVERADEVLAALAEADVLHVTLTHVVAVGAGVDPGASTVSMEFGRKVTRRVKLELMCPDVDEDRMVETVRKAACTSLPGDGVISVHNVNRLVKIRTAAESLEAL